jgi:hypothetical protein
MAIGHLLPPATGKHGGKPSRVRISQGLTPGSSPAAAKGRGGATLDADLNEGQESGAGMPMAGTSDSGARRGPRSGAPGSRMRVGLGWNYSGE